MKEQMDGFKISKRTYISTLLLLVTILLLAGVLTQLVPQGFYQYQQLDGRSVIVPNSYHQATGLARLPVWRWFTAPIEVLFTQNALTAIMIMLFILLIGGSFLVLERSGLLNHMMYIVIRRFEHKKYGLLAAVTFVCMLLGSTMGLFEETVTLVPITVALALMLGWDSLVGIGMSILAVGCGFSAGTLNPFTVGVTQELAGLPAFSGLLLRLGIFVSVFGLLYLFLYRYAKAVEKNPQKSMTYAQDLAARQKYQSAMAGITGSDPQKQRGLRTFILALLFVFIYVIAAFFVPALSGYAMPVMAVCFACGALAAGRIAGLRSKLFKTFCKGMASIAPSVLLILLAMSVTHIMQQGNIIDTILYFCHRQIEHLGPYGGALAIFALVLAMNFFIGSAAAKAFFLIPIIIPLADMIFLTRQTAVQAFILGDGFTNMLYPTNVVLLITLGIVGVSYGKWFRWTWRLQLCLLGLSAAWLLVAVVCGYGPF